MLCVKTALGDWIFCKWIAGDGYDYICMIYDTILLADLDATEADAVTVVVE